VLPELVAAYLRWLAARIVVPQIFPLPRTVLGVHLSILEILNHMSYKASKSEALIVTVSSYSASYSSVASGSATGSTSGSTGSSMSIISSSSTALALCP
jgi:hypothetical protein